MTEAKCRPSIVLRDSAKWSDVIEDATRISLFPLYPTLAERLIPNVSRFEKGMSVRLTHLRER
jgi:hypothetical protein